eukprot:CAMPEP_0113631250 /NCGR_PEP_ID=MMETSP0017_2-20120614/16239_1 /TAXON_ID=2856 /ORGANISM="Cylindrotheca closterium" /LENGTH=483 /DNA_ID=CAMNT_0000541751 /DNA_START=64 /DNA_END=1515 /DNA_ORIENTATION=+ /assembly_acc=CAM_ASM_000147
MMRPENEGGATPTPSPTKGDDTTMKSDGEGDVEAAAAASPESKGKMAGGGHEEMTLEKLKIRLMAITEYLRQELSTMDTQKAKHLGLLAKEKAVVTALALKALMIQYLNEMKQLDKEKARELTVKYRTKTVEVAGVARRRTAEAASVARLKALEVGRELKTMDKQKSIDMVRKGKVVYKEMPQGTKIKYGVMFCILLFMWSGSPAGSYEKVKHKNLCYIHEEKADWKQKVASCENMLFSVTQGYKNWIFIGNEPIFALFRPFHNAKLGLNRVRGDRGKQRKVQFYYKYELPDEAEWKEKYADKENPTELAAKEGIGRSDCGNCPMVKFETENAGKVFENLVVESSRDVSQITKTTSTTQETVARYLGETYANQKSTTACVVQQGTYEMTKAPWRTAQEYTGNTKDFHDKLEQHCGVLIRIGYFRENGQLKDKINSWNEGTRDVVLHKSKNGYFIDVSQVGTPSMDGYITPVWEMFFRLSKALE